MQEPLPLSPPVTTRGLGAQRRIDITIDRLRDTFDALSAEEQVTLSATRGWAAIALIAGVRSMERGEEEVIGYCNHSVADVYDRIVQPGDHLIEALLRVLQAVLGGAAEPLSAPPDHRGDDDRLGDDDAGEHWRRVEDGTQESHAGEDSQDGLTGDDHG